MVMTHEVLVGFVNTTLPVIPRQELPARTPVLTTLGCKNLGDKANGQPGMIVPVACGWDDNKTTDHEVFEFTNAVAFKHGFTQVVGKLINQGLPVQAFDLAKDIGLSHGRPRLLVQSA